MSKNNIFLGLMMIWLTILTVWAVNRLTTSFENTRSLHLTGIPGQAATSQISTVQIDKDTVWLIDANSSYIKVITHDENGYHIMQSEMSFQEK
ncbi:hypothetical protein ACFOLF_11230 [Paenibacillus sepulcri]|uniref:Uncharacterized protein n=1 Tax=Paenibacillus sepulcri TaxID=359917 RepID=A0ABS7C9P2_9BACL|nr:hypothetical protein [Paenibacillus sepulcri]